MIEMTAQYPIKIRPAELRDIANLKSIWLEFMDYHAELNANYRYYPQDWPQVFQRFAHALQEEYSVLFIAEQGEKIIGYVFGFIFTNYPGYSPRRVGFINDLMVTRSQQRQGIGKQLLRAIEVWFKEKEIEVMQLYVANLNNSGRDFWQACGYEPFLIGMWKELSSSE